MFYLRKTYVYGPFRINITKSGIGISIGFGDFRIGTGPRGTYYSVLGKQKRLT